MNSKTLAENNIELVNTVVRSYLRRNPNLGYLKDDLISAGYVGLVQASNELETFEPDNVAAYLTSSIKREVEEAAAANVNPVVIPNRTRQRCRADGKSVVERTINRVPLEALTVTDPGMEMVDVMDAIEAACESDFEKQIIQMRVEGYTLIEIGAKLGCHEGTVCKTLKKIYVRYKEVTA